MYQQIWKTQQWPYDWKRSIFIPIPKNGHDKECLNYCTIALISHDSKVRIKILQARLQQYGNYFLVYKLGLEKAKEPEIKLHLLDHGESQSSRKRIYFCIIDCAQAYDIVDYNKLENS